MPTREFAITAIGLDQPGIVAAVAGVLTQVGGNVEDSAMTILGGQFAILLLVATEASGDQLSERLSEATADLGLTVHVNEVDSGTEGARRSAPLPTHVLSVYGADRPGILAGVTRALADAGANVTDLETRLLSPGEDPVYAMVIELVVEDEAATAAAIAGSCTDLGVDHTLRPLSAEVL